MSVTVLIPRAASHAIDPSIIVALKQQTVKNVIVESVNKDVDLLSERNKRQAGNMTKLIKKASYPFCVFMDSDVLPSDPMTIELCINHLVKNESLDAVAVDTKFINTRRQKLQNHVLISFMCVRTNVLKGYKFVGGNNQNGELKCCCLDFNQRFNIDYLPSLKLSEIKRGRNG